MIPWEMIPAAASSVTSPFPALTSAWPSLPACPAPHTSRVEIWHCVAPHPSRLAWTSVTIYWALTPTICFSPDKEVLAPSWVTPQTRNLPFLWSHGQLPIPLKTGQWIKGMRCTDIIDFTNIYNKQRSRKHVNYTTEQNPDWNSTEKQSDFLIKKL